MELYISYTQKVNRIRSKFNKTTRSQTTTIIRSNLVRKIRTKSAEINRKTYQVDSRSGKAYIGKTKPEFKKPTYRCHTEKEETGIWFSRPCLG